MLNPMGLERCLSFVNCQLRPGVWKLPDLRNIPALRAVTISRQAGCGALVIADKLALLLQAHYPKDSCPWTVFDHNLMEKVLEDHHLPSRIAQFLPEDRIGELQDIIDDLCGIHPPSWTLIQQTTETILHLANLGSVILIGRGANVITAKLPNVFHVRLVAPLEDRVEHAHKSYNVTKSQAREFCLHEDRGRKRYLRKYFKADVDDALLYHLTINTGMVSYDDAARLIVEAALAKSI